MRKMWYVGDFIKLYTVLGGVGFYVLKEIQYDDDNQVIDFFIVQRLGESILRKWEYKLFYRMQLDGIIDYIAEEEITQILLEQ